LARRSNSSSAAAWASARTGVTSNVLRDGACDEPSPVDPHVARVSAARRAHEMRGDVEPIAVHGWCRMQAVERDGHDVGSLGGFE